MRLLIADYSGHPFQVELSRALAARGHEVLHLYSASSETPKGELERRPDDPPGFETAGVTLGEPVEKRNFFKRRRQEIRIGEQFAEVIHRYRPELAILGNLPIDTLARAVPALDRVGSKFVFWVQDLLGEAAIRVLSAKLGAPGALIGRHYRAREARFLRRADHIVAIAEDFRPHLTERLGIGADRVSVVENWSPIGDIPLLSRDNDWAKANLPASPLRIIYSGTLGFKQDPDVLLAAAAAIDCHIIVFSEGAAANALAGAAAERGLANLEVRGWVDFAALPAMLAGADLLAVMLEPDAGVFSVPSKVLTYMCVGRPILAAIPSSNLAARLICDNGAGIVVEPGDRLGFVEAARRLAASAPDRERMGRAARDYAERAFDIEAIATRFETMIEQVRKKG
jgi:colanic acid biosynthesis glycosyl transferase WcaI